MTTRLPIIIACLAATSAASFAVAAETPATTAQQHTFTLQQGENLSSLCANIRQAGVDISTPDCVKQILFANRQWFDNTFGYVWQDPAAVNLDSAIRLWAGVPYQMPAEYAQASLQGQQAQGESAATDTATPPATPFHPGHFDPKGKAPSTYTIEVLKQARASLPFADTRDFDENNKGLIAPMQDLQIMADAGHVSSVGTTSPTPLPLRVGAKHRTCSGPSWRR